MGGGGSNDADVPFGAEDFAILFKVVGGGVHGLNVPSCATTAESQALFLSLIHSPTDVASFHMGLIEIVLPLVVSVTSDVKIFKGHFAEFEL